MKNLMATLLISFCSFILHCSTLRAALPIDPVSTVAWTNATSAQMYDGYVVATAPEGVMSFFDGQPFSQIELPSAPVLVRQLNNLFMILCRSNELFLISINSRGTLSIIWRFDPGGTIEDVAFDDYRIYLARGFDGVTTYTYTVQGNISWADSSLFPIHCTDLAMKDTLLFAVDDYNGIIVYDVNEGSLHTIVDYREVPYRINDLAVGGRFVAASTEDDVVLGGTFNSTTGRFSSLDSIASASSNIVYFHDSTAFAVESDSLHLQRWIPYIAAPRTRRMQLLKSIRPTIGIGQQRFPFSNPSTLAASDDGTIISFRAMSGTGPAVHTQYTTYTGPYSNIELVDSTIYIAGANFPLQSYRLAPEGVTGPPQYVIPGLINVRDFDVRNDTLLILSPVDQSVMIYSLTNPDDPQLIRRIPVDTTQIREARFLDWPTDSMAVIGMSGENHVLIYTIRDTLPTNQASRIFMLGRILDYAFADSMLVILSNKRVIDVYRLNDDLSNSFRGSTTVNGQANHFFRIDETDGDSVSISQKLFLVSGSTLSRLNLTTPAAPLFDLITNTGFSIRQSIVQGDTMFAVGPEGLASFRILEGVPTLADIGGRPGQFIARERNLIATSSGQSVYLFSLPEDVVTDVDGEPDQNLPSPYAILDQNWPNPFNPTTTIPYALPATGPVRLTIYNILGQEVALLVDGVQAAGSYTIEWNGRNTSGQQVASGLYLYRLELVDRAESRKMMLLR